MALRGLTRRRYPERQIAGTSITATCASARSQDASATLTTPIRGNGAADFTGHTRRTSGRNRRHLDEAPADSDRHELASGRNVPKPIWAWRDQYDWTAEKYRRLIAASVRRRLEARAAG